MARKRSIDERNRILQTRLEAGLCGRTITDVTVLRFEEEEDGVERRNVRLNFSDGTCFVIEWHPDMRLRFATEDKPVEIESRMCADLFLSIGPTIGKVMQEGRA